MPNTIPADFFDSEQLETERFLGKIVESEIREGTIGKLAGATVWYLEVENISREMPFNYSKELVPTRGPNSLWTRMVKAFEGVGYKLSSETIPLLKGRYFFFNVRDLTMVDSRTGEERLITRNFFWPAEEATQEDVDAAYEKRGLPTEKIAEPIRGTVKKVEEVESVSEEDIEALVLAIIDGKKHEEFLKEAAAYPELKPIMPELTNKSYIGKLIAKKRLGIEAGKYKVR